MFLFSGLVHDLVISVPANAGYGLPTLYFLIQAAGMFAERRLGIVGKLAGRLFTIFAVLAPVMLLFHPPFAKTVILPFIEFLNAPFS